ncbi:putative transcription factor lepB [Fusarium oxysporum f. sp. albedinis]|nr:putative transcription factor lepB [Fusarium oxysporum f. sp. albedinis]
MPEQCLNDAQASHHSQTLLSRQHMQRMLLAGTGAVLRSRPMGCFKWIAAGWATITKANSTWKSSDTALSHIAEYWKNHQWEYSFRQLTESSRRDLWTATPAGIDEPAVLFQVDPDRRPELSLSKVQQLKLAVEAWISTMHNQ